MSMVSKFEKITDNDLPALFCAADKASNDVQRNFTILSAINLFLLVFAAVLASLSLNDISSKKDLAIASIVILILGISVSVIIRILRLERNWYDGRSIAESVKTMSWRYMTASEPYSIDQGSKVDVLFANDLTSLLKERIDFAESLGGNSASKQQISDKMRQARNLETDDRKQLYLRDRIQSQKNWYAKKSGGNSSNAKKYFIGIILAQIFAVFSAIAILLWPDSIIKPTGIFTTVAASLLAWFQLKKYRELSQSYGLASQELGIIYEIGVNIQTEEEFSKFVSNSEAAISREHTMWRARRL
jgi:hypothetical protein